MMTKEDLRKQDGQDIRAVFHTREGARFFARLIHECGVFSPDIDKENPEATHVTAYNEGLRGAGLGVLRWLQEADGDAMIRLFQADKERTVDVTE